MVEPSGRSWIERLRALISERSSVARVAGDPALMAELLLIVRMSFADHTVNPAEASAFRALCTRALDLDADEAGEILRFLDRFGYEITDRQAAGMLAELPEARRRAIMEHLAEMARADGEVTDEERRLFDRTARRLGLK